MSWAPTAWLILGAAVGLLATGHVAASMFLAVAAGVLALLAPSEEAEDARRRNHARRVR